MTKRRGISDTEVENTAVPRADQANPQGDDSEQAIRQRAYELYLERGDADGDQVDDWLRAENEVRQRARARPEDQASSIPDAAADQRRRV